MEILITGVNSYVGNQVGAHLINQGFQVSYQSFRDISLDELSFKKYDVIFHVAGIAHVSYHKKDSKKYDEINHLLTKKIATKAKKEGVKQFIFMSSMIVYKPQKKAIDKYTRLNPVGPYAKSKYDAETALNTLSSKDFKVSILRPAMIYGKNSLGNFPRLVSLTKKIPVFPNYSNLRSFLYIEHLIMAIEAIIKDQRSGIFHLADEPMSTKTLVETIAKQLNKRLKFTKLFNFVIKAFLFIKTLNKLFGSYYYDHDLTDQAFLYQPYSLDERIKKSL